MARPIWLEEEPWLQELLAWFLNRTDGPRERDITRRIKQATVPALFHFDEDTRYRWQLVERLATEFRIFSIRYDPRVDRFREHYENAQLRFNPEAEALLREWLDRPRIDPVRAEWVQALEQLGGVFSDGGAALLSTLPTAPGLSATELATAFAAIDQSIDRGLSLRELSARCFRGDSKFLDQREELLIRLFGERAATILPRPLLLTAWAPPEFRQLLIIENQDSFLRLADQPPPASALLYSGGFRASASRLRSEQTRFAFLPGSDPAHFQERWLDQQLPTYFWGDLDFAGMAILAALRQSLPQLRAWQAGYQPMLQQLLDGGGHTAQQADKSGQTDPGMTGCDYADQRLLPTLRTTGRSLDQEAISPGHIPRN